MHPETGRFMKIHNEIIQMELNIICVSGTLLYATYMEENFTLDKGKIKFCTAI